MSETPKKGGSEPPPIKRSTHPFTTTMVMGPAPAPGPSPSIVPQPIYAAVPQASLPTPGIPLTLPAAPARADVADAEIVPEPEIEPPPNTARMLPVAPPAGDVLPAPREATVPVAPEPSAPAPLAVRPFAYERPAAPPTFRDARLVLLQEPHSPRAASFRLLRDGLVAKNLPRVLAVSSAAPHEGKTTCALNLALGMSELPGTRVLLVDANFFEPELGQVFAVEQLASLAPPDAGVWLSPFKIVEVRPTLHVAAIPRVPGQPAPRFEQPRFDVMIERLVRVSYDYIVVDTPALRGTPAVAHLLAIADGVLLAVRAGSTNTRDLRRAAEQIPPNKALGIVLVDAPT